ncbi:MAG: caspase family protein, partial [Bacteroidota bacterium]
MSQSAVYALFVGIDKYLPPVPALDGCVNDMRAMRDFVAKRTQETGVSLHMEVLENEQATRLNILKKFESHLTQAGPDDVALFYFSGHGSQENAHEIFWDIEEDKKNETLVCYDSRLADGMDLADKEVATMLDVVARKNPHILVIADCCNSGGISRDLSNGKNRSLNEGVHQTREVPLRTRPLDSYILPASMQKDRAVLDLNAQPMSSQLLIPDARHVSLSAAQPFQLAKETHLGGTPRGVFTYSLIEVLEKAVGPISYSDLMRKVDVLVNKRTTLQDPYFLATVQEDRNLTFLGGATTKSGNYYALHHDREKGWEMDAGSIQGLIGPSGEESTILAVYPEDATEAELKQARHSLGKVRITEILSSSSVVEPLPGTDLLPQNGYKARVDSLPLTGIEVAIKGAIEHGVNLAKVAMGQLPDAQVYLKLVDDPMEAEYHLTASDAQEYVISRKSDNDDQALVEQVKGFTKDSAEQAINMLVHIGKWERFLTLTNPGSSIPTSSVRVDVYHASEDRIIEPTTSGIRLTYSGDNGRARFRIKLVNTSSQKLYCSLYYMS